MTNPVNESAFPFTGAGTEGMKLRDYFAAKSIPIVPKQTAYNMKPKESHEEYVSRRAYEMADAMMKARAS